MKIKRIEPIAVSFPMKKPVVMAGVEIRQADNILVRVESDTGIVGWGEAASAPTMTGETVESMLAAVAYLTPAVEGRPAEDIAGTSTAMTTRMYANNAAKAAIEMALHDLVGRATSRPAYALLGEKRRNRMAVLAVIGTGELASDLVSYPQVLLNVRVREKVDLKTVPAVASVIEQVEARVAGQGRLLVRYSGTEPLLRIMLEGRREAEIRAWAQDIVDTVQQYLA